LSDAEQRIVNDGYPVKEIQMWWRASFQRGGRWAFNDI